MAKYKNISKQRIFVPNVGAADPGETLEFKGTLRSANFELVSESKENKPKEKK